MARHHSHHRYYNSVNTIPVYKYLREKGAISDETAISLETVESEDFKELIRLAAQTSPMVGLAPDGKYFINNSLLNSNSKVVKWIGTAMITSVGVGAALTVVLFAVIAIIFRVIMLGFLGVL